MGPARCPCLPEHAWLTRAGPVSSSPALLHVPQQERLTLGADPGLGFQAVYTERINRLHQRGESHRNNHFKNNNQPSDVFPPTRSMTTSAASCVPSTKMTAFLINLNVCGMGQTGKKGSVAGELTTAGPSPCRGPGQAPSRWGAAKRRSAIRPKVSG